MAFIPPRPPRPNPGQMAAQRAAMQAQRAGQQAGMRAQQAARNAGAGAYVAVQQRARRAGPVSDVEELASTTWVASGTQRPSALGMALRGALAGLAILLIFAVMDRYAAPSQLSGSLLLFAAATVALVMGYRVVAVTGRLGAAALCGPLIGIGLAPLGFVLFIVSSPRLPGYMARSHFTPVVVADIKALIVVVVVALVGGGAAKIVYLLRQRHE